MSGTLRDLCRRARMRQTDLADALGVCNSAVSEWSLLKRPVPPERVPAICAVLGCTPADLAAIGPVFPPETYSPVVWCPEQECLLCGRAVGPDLRCPRCRRAVA